MKHRNMNNEAMKLNNMKFVLETIREKEPISRNVLSQIVGLTSSSITNIVNRLIADGYLMETVTGKSAGGRKPIMLELNPSGAFAVGVEMDVTNMICIITDFKAKKLIRKNAETLIHEGKDKVIDRLIGLIAQTIEQSGVPREKIMGIGLVSAGPYDYKKGIMTNPPNFPGWINVPIREKVEHALGIPTFFEKETQGSAIAEFWFGVAENAKSLFAIGVKEIGIGGGVIIDGQVYHGFADGAGDIGHMTVDIDGPLCSCGSYGCLETFSSGAAMVRSAIAKIKRGEESVLKSYVSSIEEITCTMIAQGYDQDDPLCKAVIETGARYMGLAISNLISIYSPEMIILGGQIPELCPDFVDMSSEFAKKRVYPLYNKKVNIVKPSFGDEQQVYGGVGIAFQQFFNRFAH